MPGTRAQGGVCKSEHWSQIASGAPSLAPEYARSYTLQRGSLQAKSLFMQATSTGGLRFSMCARMRMHAADLRMLECWLQCKVLWFNTTTASADQHIIVKERRLGKEAYLGAHMRASERSSPGRCMRPTAICPLPDDDDI